MKLKTASILIASLINLGLLLASPPGSMGANAQRPGSYVFPCCKMTEGRPYCCQNCCFFRWDCLADEDCAPDANGFGSRNGR